jgi:hypothetical protein
MCPDCSCYPNCPRCRTTITDTKASVCTACQKAKKNICDSCDLTREILYREGKYCLCLHCLGGATRDKKLLNYEHGKCSVCAVKTSQLYEGMCQLHYYVDRWNSGEIGHGMCRSCGLNSAVNVTDQCISCFKRAKLTINAPTLLLGVGDLVCGNCYEPFKASSCRNSPVCKNCQHKCVLCATEFTPLDKEDELCAKCYKDNNSLRECRVCSNAMSRDWNAALAVCSESCRRELLHNNYYKCKHCKDTPVSSPYEVCGNCDSLQILCPSCNTVAIDTSDYLCNQCIAQGTSFN